MKFTPEQRLIVALLCDIHKKLKIDDSYDPDFISEAVLSGNDWAIDNKYCSISDIEPVSKELRTLVCDILHMCTVIENTYNELSENDKEEVAKLTRYDPSNAFSGFDGNNESDCMYLAKFMIERAGMFSWFDGRELNSHCPSLDAYKRMLSAFDNLESKRSFLSPLSAIDIATVMNARAYRSDQ